MLFENEHLWTNQSQGSMGNAGKCRKTQPWKVNDKKTILSRVPLSAHRDVYDEINCNTSKALHEQHAWNSCMAISSSSWSLSALCRLPLS